MRPATASSFDVAIWLLERARAEDTYLQPRKLQCLLFLAQGHFAAANGGSKLMPSVFVCDHAGPMDPNVYRALEHGRPEISEMPLDEPAATFVAAIWQRYGTLDAAALDRLIAERGADELAVQQRDGSEIGIEAMQRMFASPPEPQSQPAARPTAQPRVMVSQSGRQVAVEKWVPGAAPAAKTSSSG